MNRDSFSFSVPFLQGFFPLQFLLLEGRQSADVVPEGGGLALGLSQHKDLLLGQSSGERGVFLPQEEVIVRSGHRCLMCIRKQGRVSL